MKSLAAEQIKVARILLNLGHSYQHSTCLENSEDEEEEEEGEEEEECGEKKEKEKKIQLDGLKQIFKNFKEVRIGSPVNIVNNTEEEMEIQFDGEIKQVNKDIPLNFDAYLQNEPYKKAHIEEIYREKYELDRKIVNIFEKEIKSNFKTNTQKELNKQVQPKVKRKEKSNKNVHIEFGKEELKVKEKKLQQVRNNTETIFSELYHSDLKTQSYENTYIKVNGKNKDIKEDIIQKFDKLFLQELNGKKGLKEFDKELKKQQQEDKYVESDIDMQISSESQQGLDIKMQELRENQLPQKEIEVELGIEIQDNSGFQQEFCRDKQQMSNRDIEIELNIKMQVNSEVQQELDEKVHEEIDRQKQQNSKRNEEIKELSEILFKKYDKKQQLNIDMDIKNEFDKVNGLQEGEIEVQKELNKNFEFYKEFNDKMGIVEKCQQNLIEKEYNYEGCSENKKKCKEINLTCNGMLLEKFNTEKRKVDNLFDRKLEFNLEIQQTLKEKLKKYEDEQYNIDGNIQQELHQKIYQECNGELFQEFDKKKQEIKQQFLKEIQNDSELKENIAKRQNMNEKYVQNVFDKNITHIPNDVELVDNLQTEFDEGNIDFLKTKTQKEIEHVLCKTNREPKQIKDSNQLKCNEKIQVQFDRELQDIDDKTQINSDLILNLELELEAQKKMHEQIMDTFHKEIQKRIKRLVHDLLCGEQKINKKIQSNSNGELYVESIKQIQKEIAELQKEIKEFDQNQNKELERNITENIGITYSLSIQVCFLENLLFLLCQNSTPFYERIEQLCDLYFPNMCKLRKTSNNEIQTNFKSNTQQIFDKELLQKLDTILEQGINDNFHNNYDTEANIDINEINYQKLNEEMQEVKKIQQLLNNSKQQYEVNEDIMKVEKQDMQLKFQDKLKKIEEEMRVSFDEEINKKINRNIREKCKKINKETTQNFEIVKQCNSGIRQKNDEETQQLRLVQGKIQINVNEALQNFCNNENKQFEFNDEIKKVNKNWEMEDRNETQVMEENNKLNFYDKIREVEGELQKNSKEKVVYKMQQKIEDNMEIDFDKELKIEDKTLLQQYFKNEQTQERNNEKNCQQLEFVNKIQIEGEFVNIDLQDFEIDIETSKRKCLKKSDDLQQKLGVDTEDDIEELQKKSNVYFNKFQKKMLVGLSREMEDETFDVDMEELDVDIEGLDVNNIGEFDGDIQVEIKNKIELDTEEESEIDVEEFEEKLSKDFEDVIQNDFQVYIEQSKQEMQDEFKVSQQKFDKLLFQETDEKLLLKSKIPLQNIEYEMDKFKEINEVVEVVDEFETESISSVDCFISTNKEFNPIRESSSTDKSISREESASPEYGCSYSEEEFSYAEEKFSSKEEKYSFAEEYGSADDEFSSPEEDFNRVVRLNLNTKKQIKYNKNTQKFKEELQEFENLQFENLKNIQDIDKVPLELKIQKEKFENEYHQQFNKFQKEFYSNLKLKCDNEQKCKVNKSFKPVFSKVLDNQQQIFYELNDNFHEIKQEYKGFVQQKMFEELQREMDEKLLLENVPKICKNELNLIDEDIHKEFLELQRDCNKLESEFMYNVPLKLEENDVNHLLKQEPFNLFKKLHSIHEQKLNNFVRSKQWPENCFYPSSLLDSLFENPSEIKPNVLVITLYSIEIGYSIKISINKNETPLETFFNYAEDSILNYVEKEQLPPHLLDLLDKAEPKLFYCGCVIAEIHDQKDGNLDKVYRILLRPFNLSIQSDLNQIIAENNHVNWTYKKRLKLESILLLVSHPEMCMDSSPIAGLAINLQHQMLNCRSIHLNPIKNNFISSKLKSFDLLDSRSNTFFTPKLSNKQQKISSKLMDTASDNIILWEFDFCIKSFKLLKLFVLVITVTQECSMLLCMNSKIESFMKIRFKINLETNKLKAYIKVILEILRKKICSEILVVRRYKINDKSAPHSIMHIPTLFNDNIYEPIHADINLLINTLLENTSTNECDITEFESENISEVMPIQLMQKSIGIKGSSTVNKDANHKMKKSINFCGTKKLSRNSNKKLEMLNMGLKGDQIQMFESKISKKLVSPSTELLLSTNLTTVESSSRKSPPIPIDILLDINTMSSPKESSIITPETNTSVEPSLISPIMEVPLGDINEAQEELNSVSKLLSTSISDTEVISSVSNSITGLSSISNPIIITSVSGPKTNSSVLNSVAVISSVGCSTYILPSVSRPITVMSSLSSPITVISSVPSNLTVVSSKISNKLSSEVPITNCVLVSENLPRLKEHSENIDTKINSVIQTNSKYLEVNGDSKINEFGSEKHKLLTLHNIMKTTSGTFTKSLNSQYTKISTMKHLHKNGICMYGPKCYINNESIPQIDKKKTSSLESSTKNLQLDRRKKMQKFDDISSTDILHSPNLQVVLPKSISLNPSSLSQTNTQKNKDSFQERKIAVSSNIDGYKGIKRKRSTS